MECSDTMFASISSRVKGYLTLTRRCKASNLSDDDNSYEEDELTEFHDDSEVALMVDGCMIGVVKILSLQEHGASCRIGLKLDRDVKAVRAEALTAKQRLELRRFHEEKSVGRRCELRVVNYDK